jgi:methylmalonyl-CoA mutase N-terminal domain/subunit
MQPRGGFIQLFTDGWIEEQIQAAREADMKRVESGNRPVVGINAFSEENEAPPQMKFFRIGRQMIESRIAHIRAHKASARPALAEALVAVSEAAAGVTNVMPAVIRAVEAGGTLGEICDTMRAAIGYSLPH